MITEEQYRTATEKIDAAHSSDEMMELEDGNLFPVELLYSKRMLSVLELVSPDSSFEIKIAAQCQHLKRWSVSRSLYPYDRRGYHQWRQVVMDFQLQETKKILLAANIGESDIHHILFILKEHGNKLNPESQVIMDTACLVFVKWYMEPFAGKHQNEKVIDILRKTMRKMSSKGVNLISKLELPVSAKNILEQVNH